MQAGQALQALRQGSRTAIGPGGTFPMAPMQGCIALVGPVLALPGHGRRGSRAAVSVRDLMRGRKLGERLPDGAAHVL